VRASLTTNGATQKSLAWQSRLWKQYRRWRTGRSTRGDPDRSSASILLVTYNRLGMLKECVSSILANTSHVDYELIVWDNASTDGTGLYLDAIASSHPQVRVVHHTDNIGVNAVAACVRLARGGYLVEMDDDVVEVPPGWLPEMIRVFDAVPRAGYLAANVVQDETTDGAKPEQHLYRTLDYGDGVVIECGPTGGWCTMTSRGVIERIGNFLEMPGRVFFGEDGDFACRCIRRKYRVGIVRGVRVYHATGVTKNLEYGCADVCRLKYADGPEYEAHLTRILAAMDDLGETPE
jgi:GT2 family glycosyltransferase